MAVLAFKKTVIYGLGLLGGSLARDLKKKSLSQEVWAIDGNTAALKWARRSGVIDKVVTCEEGLPQADCVLLALPVKSLVEALPRVAGLVTSQALVMDVGSVKGPIVKVAERVFASKNFVGAHPMAGTEKSGVRFSLEGLFEGAPCFLVPCRQSKPQFVKKAQRLWKALGAKPTVCTAKEHDRTVAFASHLPHVIAFAFAKALPQKSKWPWSKVSGPSFQDIHRLASSDPRMWTDIFMNNQKEILAAVKKYKVQCSVWEQLLEDADEDKILKHLQKL